MLEERFELDLGRFRDLIVEEERVAGRELDSSSLLVAPRIRDDSALPQLAPITEERRIPPG